MLINMPLNDHNYIELAPTTTKGTGPFVVVFGPGTQHLNL